MGSLLESAGAVSSVRSRRHGRRGAAALRGQPHLRRGDLELPHGRRSSALHISAQKSRGAAGAAASSRARAASAAGSNATFEFGANASAGARVSAAKKNRGAFRQAIKEGERDAEAETQIALSCMAFLRFTRDKRGYEQFSLVEPT